MIVGVLFAGLWQGAAVAAIGYLVICAVPRRNATTRYAVWFSALLALVAVPLLTNLSDLGALVLAALQPRTASSAWAISLPSRRRPSCIVRMSCCFRQRSGSPSPGPWGPAFASLASARAWCESPGSAGAPLPF